MISKTQLLKHDLCCPLFTLHTDRWYNQSAWRQCYLFSYICYTGFRTSTGPLCQASFLFSGRQKVRGRKPTCPWDRKSKSTLSGSCLLYRKKPASMPVLSFSWLFFWKKSLSSSLPLFVYSMFMSCFCSTLGCSTILGTVMVRTPLSNLAFISSCFTSSPT